MFKKLSSWFQGRIRRPLHQAYIHATAQKRALPSVFIIGVQKGGTTGLYWDIIKHPQLAGPQKPGKNINYKEVHYYDRYYNEGTDWYKANYPLYQPQAATLYVDATPDYIFCPYVPQRLAQDNPQARLILLLRNPVERAYSNFQMAIRKGAEATSAEAFERAVQPELTYLQQYPVTADTFERYFYDWVVGTTLEAHPDRTEQGIAYAGRYPTRDDLPPYHFTPYLLRGIYIEQLRIWLRFFSRDQIWIASSETYFQNHEATLRQLTTDFLGLPDWSPQREGQRANRATYPHLSADLRAQLDAFYAPYNAALYDLLGYELTW